MDGRFDDIELDDAIELEDAAELDFLSHNKVLDKKLLPNKLVKIHNFSMAESIDVIKNLSAKPGLDIVVTPNIDHLARLVKEDKNSELTKVYENAALSLCDSRILEKLLKLKKQRVKEVIPGSSLTKVLFDEGHLKNKKIAIIGGNDSVIKKLRALYPHLLLSHYNPPMGFINKPDEVEKTIKFCELVQPDYIFLGVGSPRQELLAHRMKGRLSNGVALCIGASILFLVGEEKRAPEWMQKTHVEWFYRMMQNPKVLAERYFWNFVALPRVFKSL